MLLFLQLYPLQGPGIGLIQGLWCGICRAAAHRGFSGGASPVPVLTAVREQARGLPAARCHGRCSAASSPLPGIPGTYFGVP